jgi:hypothetical protein
MLSPHPAYNMTICLRGRSVNHTPAHTFLSMCHHCQCIIVRCQTHARVQHIHMYPMYVHIFALPLHTEIFSVRTHTILIYVLRCVCAYVPRYRQSDSTGALEMCGATACRYIFQKHNLDYIALVCDII